MNQQHQQINEVQQNLQSALIEPSQHIQEPVQQQVVMHYQPSPQSQQQIIVEHSPPSSNVPQNSQHHVIVQQNITSPHQQINQQAMHQSQPIVITPQQQNVVRQPYAVYQTQQKRVIHTAVPQQQSKI